MSRVLVSTREQGRPYQEIGRKLKQQIGSGNYQVGERLPPERVIAEQLYVSRTVIREAIIMLELEGLVEVRKGSGVYVVKQHSAGVSEPVDMADHGPFEMLQARQLLESNIAEFAAMQATPSDISELRAALEVEKQEIESLSGSFEGDKMFHLALAEATQNSVLVKLLEKVWELRENSSMWKKLHSRFNDSSYRTETIDEHAEVFEAVRRKDPERAKKAMWQHLENVKEKLMELSDVDDPDFDGFQFQANPIKLS